MDSDEWILEAGDEVIHAKEERELSDLERLIYMIWVLDYAVRNAGSKESLEDFPDFKREEFEKLALDFGFIRLGNIPNAENDEVFCQTYYAIFEDVIANLKNHYKLKT